jgi:hypothetical protein
MSEPTPPPDHIVSREAKRQAVILLFSVAGAIVTVYVMRHMSNPDIFRTLKMSASLKLKRAAQSQADMWQGLADKAATWYNQEKA